MIHKVSLGNGDSQGVSREGLFTRYLLGRVIHKVSLEKRDSQGISREG